MISDQSGVPSSKLRSLIFISIYFLGPTDSVKTGGYVTLYPIADGNDYVQIVIIQMATNLSFSLFLNC